MRIERFEDIKAWQEARELVNLVYAAINASKSFRKDFRLVNQLQGASVSCKATKSLFNFYLYLKVLPPKFKVTFM